MLSNYQQPIEIHTHSNKHTENNPIYLCALLPHSREKWINCITPSSKAHAKKARKMEQRTTAAAAESHNLKKRARATAVSPVTKKKDSADAPLNKLCTVEELWCNAVLCVPQISLRHKLRSSGLHDFDFFCYCCL